jgi:putative ABC transport system permease protein
MNLRFALRIALRALSKNRLQTALTILGMTIGVATVLAMISLGSGARLAIQDQVRAAGMNVIFITAGNFKVKTEDDGQAIEENARLKWNAPREALYQPALWGNKQPPLILVHAEDDPLAKHDHPTAAQRLGDSEAGLGSAATLLPSDAEAIRRLKGVQYVSEGVHENVHVALGSERWFTRIHGDDVTLPLIRRAWKLSSGRFYNRREQRNAEQVVVLGTVVARKLFGSADPVGQAISIWKQRFDVVGVVSTGSWITPPAPGDDQFDAVYVPYTTIHRLLNLSKLKDITVTAESTGDVTRLSKAISELLRQRHKITAAMADDFTITTQARQALAKGGMRPEVARAVVGNVGGLERVTLEELGATLDRASSTMTALLIAIAAVSLVVGGIGIMNIMLLSVTERTKEIGLRRAVGARSKDVLTQFLLEAITLSLLGGIFGIAVGSGVSVVVSKLALWSASVSTQAVIISLGIAAGVGIFFGYYPARQASEVTPIESLRYE